MLDDIRPTGLKRRRSSSSEISISDRRVQRQRQPRAQYAIQLQALTRKSLRCHDFEEVQEVLVYLEASDGSVFARLVLLNNVARRAIEGTLCDARTSDHHLSLLGTHVSDDSEQHCFSLSLNKRPRFPKLGWQIGVGHSKLPDCGVDLLLSGVSGQYVEGVHASFAWVKGAGGFFVVANQYPVYLNGRQVRGRQVIPLENTLLIGECLFVLEYVQRSFEEEHKFQQSLAKFYHTALDDTAPLITSTPSGRETRFGEWVIQYPISQGSYGVVYMVTHGKTGEPAAAKLLISHRHNKHQVEHELAMVKRIQHLKHDHLAKPMSTRREKRISKAEVDRIRSLLDQNWSPFGHIQDQYLIFSPLLSTTLSTVIRSKLQLSTRITLLWQLLDAVAYLHRHFLYHRDIKPDNILVKQYDPPMSMLTDFGFVTDKETNSYDPCGTPAYNAPEQMLSQAYDARGVDSWSCGLVGMELIDMDRSCPFHHMDRLLPGPPLEACYEWLDAKESLASAVCTLLLEVDPVERLLVAPAADKLKVYSCY